VNDYETIDYHHLRARALSLNPAEKFAFARQCIDRKVGQFSESAQDRAAVYIYKTLKNPACDYNLAVLILWGRAEKDLSQPAAHKEAIRLLKKASTPKARKILEDMGVEDPAPSK